MLKSLERRRCNVKNVVNWFEIPTADIERAAKFYGAIFDAQFEIAEAMPGFKMAQFPHEEGVGGALLQGEGYTPTASGALVYLNGGDDLSVVLDRVEAAGGQVLLPKTSIGENGFMAYLRDTEGNRVGLHSMS
jgi:predicted enzyme related to lactoylglutathione lyase